MSNSVPGLPRFDELSDYVSRDEAGRYVIHRPLQAEEVLRVSEVVVAHRMMREGCISRPEDAALLFNRKLALAEVEHFCVVYLDTGLAVLAFEVLSVGTINATTVFPREVVKSALKHNAASVIFAHNHPSGGKEASHADVVLTSQLVSALKLVDIRVLDHLIIAGNQTTSMASQGLL